MQMTWKRGLKAEGKENREISVTENNNKKKKVHSADKEDKREGLGEGKKGTWKKGEGTKQTHDICDVGKYNLIILNMYII